MYKATQDVNTEYGNFKVGDIVQDIIGEKYKEFEFINGTENQEILTETPTNVQVITEITKDVIEE